MENLLLAWKEFIKGKKNRKDVQLFESNLMGNIFDLHNDLVNKKYKHGKYEAFNISDPKPRNIHKATVRDRLLHHAIYRKLYPYFDKRFTSDSYSCRISKGTHKAINRFRCFAGKVSRNHTRTCWVLKCDIKKFFASIDHDILISILKRHNVDGNIIWLLEKIIKSFHTSSGKGLPLGNLTSQLLVNIYMNEFDHYVKHKLRVKYYIRYADDFVFLSSDKNYLKYVLYKTNKFLFQYIKLKLHPNKIYIKALTSGVDFLGWIHFTSYRIVRTSTKRRIIKRLNRKNITSYLGLLTHGNECKLHQRIKKQLYWSC